MLRRCSVPQIPEDKALSCDLVFHGVSGRGESRLSHNLTFGKSSSQLPGQDADWLLPTHVPNHCSPSHLGPKGSPKSLRQKAGAPP